MESKIWCKIITHKKKNKRNCLKSNSINNIYLYLSHE